MNTKLEQNIQFLPGVGPKKAELLEKHLGITSYEDVLRHFPYRYIDRSKIFSISEVTTDVAFIQLKGRIENLRQDGPKNRQRLVATLTDGTGYLELVWFKGVKWVKERIVKGAEYIVFGKPSFFNRKLTIAHPELEPADQEANILKAPLQPMYNTSEKMKDYFINSKAIQKIAANIFSSVSHTDFYETLPAHVISKFNLPVLSEAFRSIHFPTHHGALQKARFRFKFEELFYIQLGLLRIHNERERKFNGFVFDTVGDCFNDFYNNNLTFELTHAQKRVIKEIRRNMGSGKQMNRLLQGDVGSGKTLVALMCMLIAIDNGFQAAIMAPTEILAHQHYETISSFLEGLDIEVYLLTGSTRKAQRNVIYDGIASGRAKILIGTHALIEDTVQFKNLGFVVIDEQHRFGVKQRAKLWQKNERLPHVLVMTATPIPRTLAMTVYGDLDVSVIDELPPGRKPIQTVHYTDSKRLRLFGFLKKEMGQGRQVYVVYPLIQESEKLDYKFLEDGYEALSREFPPPQYTISCVHGKMKNEEKEYAMKLFVSGKSQILVSTTVIEVGVNVPNASVMVIESAEKFGLSQLHQLRGRVGRGAYQSYCILMTSYKLTKEAKVRMNTMVATNDGFEIAEADLKLRGPGDIEGTQQSGVPFDLKIASLSQDGQILALARETARAILDDDPDLQKPENFVMVKQLKKIRGLKTDWSYIS
jgi:ATP-dependent DNA helicase RecG